MWTGDLPYEASNDPEATAEEILAAHVFGEVIPLRSLLPTASPSAEKIVHRLLEKDRAKRYPSAEELGRDLHALILEIVPPTHPAALQSARSSALESEDWATFAEPDAIGATPPTGPAAQRRRARHAETAPLDPAALPPDRLPWWVPQPHRDAAADTLPAAVDPRRLAPGAARPRRAPRWEVTEPMPKGGAAALAAQCPDGTQPLSPQLDAPKPSASRPSAPIARIAPIPGAALLDTLASASELSADERALWDDEDTAGSRRRVLFLRYLALMSPHFDSVPAGVEQAIGAYLDAAEASAAREDASPSCTAPAQPTGPTPPAFATPARNRPLRPRRTHSRLVAITAGCAVAAVTAGLRWGWAPPAAGTQATATATEEVPSPLAPPTPALSSETPAPSSEPSATSSPAASSAPPLPVPPPKPLAKKPATTTTKPPAPVVPAEPAPAEAPPAAIKATPIKLPSNALPPSTGAPRGTALKLPSNAAPRPPSTKATF